MASDFTCNTTSSEIQSSVSIEVLTCTEDLHSRDNIQTPRTIEIMRATFVADRLNIIDINAKRRFLTSKHHGNRDRILADLHGIFANPDGGTAQELLRMSEFADLAVVTGGIYFSNVKKSWPETNETTLQGDGFVWFKPDRHKAGSVLSEQQGNFTTGGYLMIGTDNTTSLLRLNAATPFAALDEQRLVIQSNMILVADGKEDGNPDNHRNAVAALSAQRDGTLSLTVAAEPGKPSNGFGFTHKEFGEQLAKWGSQNAINLDGGPSAQFAVRQKNCTHNSESCVDDLVDHTDETNRMPQLFTVSK